MNRLPIALSLALIAAACGGGEPESGGQVPAAASAGRGGAPEQPPPQGHPIGTISTRGDLVILELDEGLIAAQSLFDLEGRTLRFTPGGQGYRVQNLPLEWDADFGPRLDGTVANLRELSLPFSGRRWTTLAIGSGAIVFTGSPASGAAEGGGLDRFAFDRFDELREAAPALVNTVPAIAVFYKPRLRGPRHVKEAADRVVVTWDASDPARGIQDFTFVPTTDRFQAVLHADGSIDLSYQELWAEDAVVGVYAVPEGGATDPGPVDLSTLTGSEPASPVVYEAFHYYERPETQSMACTVIGALGDHFDFMVWYSDFRVDQQEGGTPSTGAIGDAVTGLGERGPRRRQPSQFCSDGRIQSTYIQPVWIGANQSMERARDGSWENYDYAMSQVPHELGHRWAAFSRAIVDGDTIDLGPTHWDAGLQAVVPYSYSGAPEASMMGGGNFVDNGDGTYSRLADNFYVPASGPAYIDLYLMGMLSPDEVPDFYILKNLEQVGRDVAGNPTFSGDRVDLTIQDVIANNGPRLPPADEAQREFSTAMVGVVLPGRSPSPELLERLEGIRRAWVDYWSKTTNGISTMITTPEG